jgi:peptidoglycan hydrolase-like protein with peptidoglycan-binding domain
VPVVEAPPLPVVRPAPARPAAPPAGSPPAAARDPIADLIRIGGGAPPTPPALVGKPDTRTVAAGQRALAKLGYRTAKVDGVMGPDTRLAIERFERERRIPVTGEFGGRTARELAALSGIAVE